MNYWVLRADSADGAIIDALPERSPSDWRFDEGERLAREFPAGGKVAFSDHYPDRRKLYDFVRNTVGVVIASQRVRQAVEALELDNIEFLPITMCDHQWNPTGREYGILNVLGSQDVIDMEHSRYRLSPIDKEIWRMSSLVLKKDGITPGAGLFRARKMMGLILMSDRVHDAFVRAGLTGFKAYPAEGFDDMFA